MGLLGTLCEKLVMSQLCIFNPDHDLALAHGANHYVSPTSAVKFAADAALLPLWLAEDAMVCATLPPLPASFMETAYRCGLQVQLADSWHEVARCDRILPWGWNHNLARHLQKQSIPAALLPTDQQLEKIRELSHRRLSRQAMQFLQGRLPDTAERPLPATELTTIEEVEHFVAQHGEVVLKMPWSGSGRGLRLIKGTMTTHQRGWATQSIRKYGCVMGELYYAVVQDFAIEFDLSQSPSFCGYSLFTTRHGVYQENLLLSDAMIEQRLSAYVKLPLIHAVREAMEEFLDLQVAPYYQGIVGVDMFVYQKDGEYYLHPAVELNLRLTMGWAAHQFYRRYVREGSVGRWRLRYLPDENALLEEDAALRARYPLRVEQGRVVDGYLSLTPVYADTEYAVQCWLT